MATGYRKYHETMLKQSETAVLYELEDLLGRPIPDISNSPMDVFGFMHDNYHIYELRLFTSFFDRDIQLTYLPDSIGDLEYLDTLDISHNAIQELPSSVTRLEELERFYLDYNKFQIIPEEIKKLDNLTQLNFDDNLLEGVPRWISKIEYLQSFQLAGNYLREFPYHLSSMRYLRRLILNRNLIENFSFVHLDDFSQLYVLDIRHNKISENEVQKMLAYQKLKGYSRKKYYLGGRLNDYEHPFSLRNITKKLQSENKERNPEELEQLANHLFQEYKGRYHTVSTGHRQA